MVEEGHQGANGSRGSSWSSWLNPVTGGTGKLTGIQGIVRTTGTAEPKAGVNETQVEIEYSIGK
jgi:hypothetical protein